MKKFLTKISYTLFPVWLFLVGLTVYYNVYVKPKETGDLGIIGKIPFDVVYNDQENTSGTSFKNAYSAEEVTSCKSKVLTIGDSFSQQKTGYQIYMISNGLDVVNYRPPKVVEINPFQSASDLLNNNYIDSAYTKTIVVESVERLLVSRLKTLNCNHNFLPQTSASNNNEKKSKAECFSLLEAKNFLVIHSGLMKPVRHEKLSHDLFLEKFSRDLYFYQEDVTLETQINQSDYQIIKESLDKLFEKAEEKGVKLLIMIAVDKYDLYQKYIINNPYPQKTINEDLQKITNNDNRIIYTKNILQPLIDNGEKDVYWIDNTHWSTKGAQAVGNYLSELLK